MQDDTFRWIIAGGVAIATLSIMVLTIMMFVLFRVLGRLENHIDRVVQRAEPLVDSVRAAVYENSPKVSEMMSSARETAANARDISVVAKDQANRFADLGRDITDRAKVQVARVDAVVDQTVEEAQHLGSNVKSAVMKPVSEVSGVLAGIKAGVSTYAQGRRPNVSRVTQDEEMFI